MSSKKSQGSFGFSFEDVKLYEVKRESGNLSVSDIDSHFMNMAGSLTSSTFSPQGIKRNSSQFGFAGASEDTPVHEHSEIIVHQELETHSE